LLFRAFILRPLRQQPARSITTVAGITLGIAVVIAIQLANASSIRGFATALDAIAGAAALEIVTPGGSLEEERLGELLWLTEYGEVSPIVEGDAGARVGADRYEAVRVLGVDILRDRTFRDYQLLSFEGGSRQPSVQEFLRLLIDPDALVTTEVFASRHGLRVGSHLELSIGDTRGTFIVRGLLRNEGPARALDGNFVLMDIAAAQLAFDRLGRLDRVELRLPEGRSIDDAERTIASRLPPGLQVERPSRRGEQVETMLRAFQFNLAALSYIALLVGLFLVYNTVAVSVIARREEIGMLRALGVTRRGVLAMFLGEAGALALVAAGLGAPAGWVLAQAAVRLTGATVNTLYVTASTDVPPLGWGHVALAFALGVGLSMIAALTPALEASRVTPLAAIRGSDRAEIRARVHRTPLVVGLVLLLVGWALSFLPPVDGLPIYGFVSAAAIVFGIACLVPAALTLVTRGGRMPLIRAFGVEGRLAHGNLSGAIPRLSVSVAALAVALAMLVAIAIMIGSFRQTVIYWVGQTLQADLFISTARRASLGAQPTISPELERIVSSHPAVAAVDRFTIVNLTYDSRLVVLGAGDFDVLLDHGTLVFKEPADGRAAVRSAIGRDAVVVSEAFALKAGVHAGDWIQLATPVGPRRFQVAAIYFDYSTDRGVVTMDRRTFAQYFGEGPPTRLAVYLKPGASPDAAREELMAQLGGRHRVFIHTNASLRAEVLRIFDNTFAITYALEAIAIFVGIMGVSGTLLTLILDRRRDLATLRLVGADRRQVRRMVVIEAGLIGLVSQALGLAAGLALSLLLIYVVNVQSFGWTIQFDVPVLFLLQSAAAVLVATTLAGLYPARIAGLMAPIQEPDE
jgi:putative ABC transport system permease protein